MYKLSRQITAKYITVEFMSNIYYRHTVINTYNIYDDSIQKLCINYTAYIDNLAVYNRNYVYRLTNRNEISFEAGVNTETSSTTKGNIQGAKVTSPNSSETIVKIWEHDNL